MTEAFMCLYGRWMACAALAEQAKAAAATAEAALDAVNPFAPEAAGLRLDRDHAWGVARRYIAEANAAQRALCAQAA